MMLGMQRDLKCSITVPDGKEYEIHPLKIGELQVVEMAERHVILLEENARALIVENQDMSNSVTEPIEEEVRREIYQKI